MSDAPSAPVESANRRAPEDDERRGRADHGLQLTGRSLLVARRLPRRRRSRRCTTCCRSSPASRTPGTGSRTAARTGCSLALLFTRRHVRRLRAACSAASSCARARAADRLARELPDHDGRARGVADLRRRRRGRARADGVGAAALGHAQARWSPTRRCVPDPHVHPVHGRGDRLRLGLRLGHLRRRGAVRPHRRAGDPRGDRARRSGSRSRSCRPTSSGASGPRVASRGRLARARAEGSPTCPPRRRPGMRDALAHLRDARPGAARRDPVLGVARSSCCGRRSARSATRRRGRCSCRRSSSACSATCCRCRAASAASRAA